MHVLQRLITKPNSRFPCHLSFTCMFVLQLAFLFGAVVGIAACVWIHFGSGVSYIKYEIYAVAVLLGECSYSHWPCCNPPVCACLLNKTCFELVQWGNVFSRGFFFVLFFIACLLSFFHTVAIWVPNNSHVKADIHTHTF